MIASVASYLNDQVSAVRPLFNRGLDVACSTAEKIIEVAQIVFALSHSLFSCVSYFVLSTYSFLVLGYATASAIVQRVMQVVTDFFAAVQSLCSHIAHQAYKTYLIFCMEFASDDTAGQKIVSVAQNLFVLIKSLSLASFYGCKDTLNDVCHQEGANGAMAIQALCLFDPSVDELGRDQRQPLLVAAEVSNTTAIDILTSRCGAQLNAVNAFGDNAFLIAARLGDLDTVRHFVEKYPSVISHQNSLGHTALHLAVLYQHFEMANYLKERCRDMIDAQDVKGYTPLHHTVQLIRRDMLKRVVATSIAAIVLNEIASEFKQLAPIHRNWVEDLSERKWKDLLFKRLQLTFNDLVSRAEDQAIKDLVFETKDQIEHLFLHGNRGEAGDIIARFPEKQGIEIKSFFYLREIANLLRELEASIGCLSAQDKSLVKALFNRRARSYRLQELQEAVWFFQKEHQIMVQSLVIAGARSDLLSKLKRVIAGLPKGQRGDFEDLINLREQNLLQSLKRIVDGLAQRQRTLAESLIESGAQDLPTQFGESVVHLSIKEGNPALTVYLAGRFPSAISRLDNKGCQPLHYCLDLGDYGANGLVHADFETFYALVSHVVQAGDLSALELRDRFGLSVLYKMVHAGNFRAVQCLVGVGAKVTYDPASIPWDESLMHLAVARGSFEMVQYLADQGAPLDQVNGSGQTPFFLACLRAFGKHEADADAMLVLNLLKDRGVDVDHRDHLRVVNHQRFPELEYENVPNCSVLYKMIDIQSADGVQYLVEAGASVVGEQGPHKETLMHVTARKGSLATMALLRDQNVPPADLHENILNKVDDKGRTPLYYAVIRAFTNPRAAEKDQDAAKIVDLLLEEMIDADHRDQGGDGYSILYYLLMKGGSLAGVQRLIKGGDASSATLDPKFPCRRTLMHAAAEKCGSDVVEWLKDELVRSGLEGLIHQLDDHRHPAIYYAAVRAFTKPGLEDPDNRRVVEILAPVSNLNQFYGPFHTILYQLLDLNASVSGVQCLVESGARTDIPLQDNLTLMHVAAEKCGVKMVSYLEEQGVPIDQISENLTTPLSLAAKRAFSNVERPEQEILDIVDFFLDKGARRDVAITLLRRDCCSLGDRMEKYVSERAQM